MEVVCGCLDDIRRLQREPVQADAFFSDVGVEVADQGQNGADIRFSACGPGPHILTKYRVRRVDVEVWMS